MHNSLMNMKLLSLLPVLTSIAVAQTRTTDVIYLKSGGAAFTMDVVQPSKPNKAGVIVMMSGGWVSDHSMIKSPGAQIEQAFTSAGFTVFEVVHRAQPRYKVPEIVDQVRKAANFVHQNAAKYGVDPTRIGVTGISSGGHLSLMIGGSPDAPVQAVAAIAPPTDFMDWGKPDLLFTSIPALEPFLPAVGMDAKTPRTDALAIAHKMSPVDIVTPKFPPTLIVQGDADTLVPLQQAEAMDKALAAQRVIHKLEVVPGGGHDLKTFIPGVMKAVIWFKAQLLR